MKTKARIESILKTTVLDTSITGFDTFDLLSLDLPNEIDFELPTNLRLGHLAEKVIAESINLSSNYKIIFENTQIFKGKETIGELDFIIEELQSKKIIHLELAYKFYLFDPNISEIQIENWVGPNRKDSLIEKLDKLRLKQFPLLAHPSTKSILQNINIGEITQALCLLVSLFIPYEYKSNFTPTIRNALRGYYLNIESFKGLNHLGNRYYIPSKKEWGMDPSLNNNWSDFREVEKNICASVEEKQAPMVWLKDGESYKCIFIVWW